MHDAASFGVCVRRPRRLIVGLVLTSFALGLGSILLACGGDPGVTDPGPGEVASVAVTPTDLSMTALGDTVTLSATARDAGGATVPGASFTWSSSDVNVATVSATGLLTAMGNGTTTVTARAAGVDGSASVDVTQEPVRLAFRDPSSTVEGQEPFEVTVLIADANGHEVPWTTGVVEVALATGPEGAVLEGTTAVGAINGVATFDDLSIALPGEGVRLEATSASLTAATSDPFRVGLTFVQLAAGNGRRSCGLTAAGHAYCWGRNAFGEVGDGTTTDRASPVPVVGGHRFEAISTGSYHTCALTSEGTAYCWGENHAGQLGDGGTTGSTEPIRAAEAYTFDAIEAGFGFTCGIASGGATYCWGTNGRGELGDGTMVDSPAPVEVAGGHVFTQISAGVGYTCGLTDGQKAYCWGYGGGTGQLGNNQGGSVAVPDSVWYDGAFASIRAGSNHTCAVTPAGAAMCWGNNGSGQLGIGSTTHASVPELVSGSLQFTEVSPGGASHTCAITTTGEGYCWGLNDDGQLGTGTFAADSVPVPVTGGLTFATVTAGLFHSCGVTDEGRAYCWGRNSNGQLGDGTGSDSAVPVETSG